MQKSQLCKYVMWFRVEIIKHLEKLRDSEKIKSFKLTYLDFPDREIIELNADKPSGSILVELFGCFINSFGKKDQKKQKT